jgi:hypothetical protein
LREELKPELLAVDMVNPIGAVILTVSFAGCKFKPESVYVNSLDELIITLPNGNDAGLTSIAGATPLPLTDTLCAAAPPPACVMVLE